MNIIVAVDNNWGIGLDGTQPVVISEDRKHFRELTRGAAVIVGRRTLLDFPGGRPLKGRRNIVLTGDRDFKLEGTEAVHSVEEALEAAKSSENVFVIGGESVYRQLLPCCSRAYVTKIEASPEADAYFPNLDEAPDWELCDPGEELESGGVKYRFTEYRRLSE